MTDRERQFSVKVRSLRPGVAWLRATTVIDDNGKARTKIEDIPPKEKREK
jgi:hypothetical protein